MTLRQLSSMALARTRRHLLPLGDCTDDVRAPIEGLHAAPLQRSRL
jgi:hypothetical protein